MLSPNTSASCKTSMLAGWILSTAMVITTGMLSGRAQAMSVDKFKSHTAEQQGALIQKFITRICDDIKEKHPEYSESIYNHFLGAEHVGIVHLFGAMAAVEIEQSKGKADTSIIQVEDLVGLVIEKDLQIKLSYDHATKRFDAAPIAEPATQPATQPASN